MIQHDKSNNIILQAYTILQDVTRTNLNFTFRL